MTIKTHPLLWVFCLLTSFYLQAEESLEKRHSKPPVSINIGIESIGLQRIVDDVDMIAKDFSVTLDKLANNQSLNEQQKQQLFSLLAQLDNITQNLNQGIEKLPQTIDSLATPLQRQVTETSDKLLSIIIVAGIMLILVLIAMLAAVFYFVLMPLKDTIVQTTGDMRAISKSLEEIKKLSEKLDKDNAN